MSLFSYKIEHDFGLAPNPFGGYCTLAVCRGSVRGNKGLRKGTWVIGTGSRSLEKLRKKPTMHHLIFAMCVEELVSFDEYWMDSRFQYKKPVISGSLVQMYGDNIYHKDDNGNWIQENSAHSLTTGQPNQEHLVRDTKVNIVAISQDFYYFGNNAIQIPEEYLDVCSEGRNMKGPGIPKEASSGFIEWLTFNYDLGIHGDPINWVKHLDSAKLE